VIEFRRDLIEWNPDVFGLSFSPPSAPFLSQLRPNLTVYQAVEDRDEEALNSRNTEIEPKISFYF
jgi:hypothetical protein